MDTQVDSCEERESQMKREVAEWQRSRGEIEGDQAMRVWISSRPLSRTKSTQSVLRSGVPLLLKLLYTGHPGEEPRPIPFRKEWAGIRYGSKDNRSDAHCAILCEI